MDFKSILNKISELQQQVNEEKTMLRKGEGKAKVKPLPKGTVHKGTYGADYDTDDEGDEQKKAAPAAKRGRGRPRKDADETGQVKQYDTKELEKIGWMPKAPKKIPPGRKHSLKEWFNALDNALMNETLAPGQKPIPVVGKQGDTQQAGAGFLNVTDTSPAAQALGKAVGDLAAQKKVQVVVPTQGQPTATQTTTTQPAPAGATGQVPTGQTAVKEKWGTSTKVAPSEKGKYAGKDKAELLKSYNALKKSGPHKKGSPEFGRMRELAFAIRAKGDWGKVSEGDIPSDQTDMGAGLGAGRSATAFEAVNLDAPRVAKIGADTYHVSYKGNSIECSRREVPHYKQELIKMATERGQAKNVAEGAKPDFLDLDKDGNRKETMKKAAADKKKKTVKENRMVSEISQKLATKAYAHRARDAFELGDIASDEEGHDLTDKACDKAEKTFNRIGKKWGKGAQAQASDAADKEIFGERKRTVKEGISERISAARLEGKAHGLRGNEYRGKHYDDMEEARAYHEGYKEGLDECYGQMPTQDFVGEEGLPASVPGIADESAFPFDDGMDEGNAFGAAIARTPKGGSFSLGGNSFTDRTNYDVAFESWDNQLNDLLNEGVTVSISKGQGGSDSVNINATDAEADQLLTLVKHAGLGIFGGDESATDSQPVGFGGDEGEAGAGEIEVVDDPEDMLSLIKKLSGNDPSTGSEESPDDYADEEGTESNACADCGSEECECGSGESSEEDSEEDSSEDEEEQVDEVESVDQMTYQVAEEGDEEEQVTEWANDAGEGAKDFNDEQYQTDIDFITKTLGNDMHKEKQTGQTTIPVIAGQKQRMGSDGMNESSTDTIAAWKKLSGIK